MPSGGSSHEGHENPDIEQLRREVQLLAESQASNMEVFRNMLADFARNIGRAGASNVEDGVAVGGSPGGATPATSTAAVRENRGMTIATAVQPTSGHAEGGNVRDTRAEREAILHDGELPNVGAAGRGGTAVPAEVGPPRGQPDQPGRAGERGAFERGAFASGEFGGGFTLPSSRHFAFKHASGPTFSGKRSDFNPWTRDTRIHAKTIGFLGDFVSKPPE